jgi:Ni/Co efflux regulator RcnB
MKKIVYGLAALAAIALAMPSIASAEDTKEGMKEDKMHHPMPMHHHHHHHHHHHMMKKDMKKGM